MAMSLLVGATGHFVAFDFQEGAAKVFDLRHG